MRSKLCRNFSIRRSWILAAMKMTLIRVGGLLLGLLSFCLTFFLCLWLAFFFVYYGTQQGESAWFGTVWRKAVRGATSAGPLSVLISWAGLAAAMGVAAPRLGGSNRSHRVGMSIASLTKVLSNLGVAGALVSFALVLVLLGVRLILFRQ